MLHRGIVATSLVVTLFWEHLFQGTTPKLAAFHLRCSRISEIVSGDAASKESKQNMLFLIQKIELLYVYFRGLCQSFWNSYFNEHLLVALSGLRIDENNEEGRIMLEQKQPPRGTGLNMCSFNI